MNINNELNEINELIVNLKFGLNEVQKKFKKIERKMKKKKKTPSGFAKPQKLSSELCCFLNLEENSVLPRTDVTKLLINYIKENKLNKSNVIYPDKKLLELLDNTNDKITYFSIQKHMNRHYIKN
jgi:chromatin remodeling complex protein RSC6